MYPPKTYPEEGLEGGVVEVEVEHPEKQLFEGEQ
jgi:hypothetical protein